MYDYNYNVFCQTCFKKKNPESGAVDDKFKRYRLHIITKLGETDLQRDKVEPFEEVLYQYSISSAKEFNCYKINNIIKLYLSICSHHIVNLIPTNSVNNTEYAVALNTELIDFNEAVLLDPSDMHPEHWKKLIAKKQIKINKDLHGPMETTDIYTCGKCKSNKCRYFESQDRSADEGMTLHIICCNCGKRWHLN